MIKKIGDDERCDKLYIRIKEGYKSETEGICRPLRKNQEGETEQKGS